MKISIYCIGKLKESYWVDAVNEYLKRIQRFSKIEIVEFPDVAYKEGENEELVKDKECLKVLQKLNKTDFVIGLDLNRKEVDSVKLSEQLSSWFVKGGSNISFVIGGSLGLSKQLKERCNDFLTLSKLTLPHQLCRVFLLEQIYRSFKILNHETYHK